MILEFLLAWEHDVRCHVPAACKPPLIGSQPCLFQQRKTYTMLHSNSHSMGRWMADDFPPTGVTPMPGVGSRVYPLSETLGRRQFRPGVVWSLQLLQRPIRLTTGFSGNADRDALASATCQRCMVRSSRYVTRSETYMLNADGYRWRYGAPPLDRTVN